MIRTRTRNRASLLWLDAGSVGGFTLLETIVVLMIIGILFAIVAPAWNHLLNVQRLNTAQEEIFQAIRTAQSNAKLNRIDWQFSLRSANGTVQWAIHSKAAPVSEVSWNSLDSSVRLDEETSLDLEREIRRVQFNERGSVNGQLGRVTLSGNIGGRTKRCVIVSTLLGAIRNGTDHTAARDGKYCY